MISMTTMMIRFMPIIIFYMALGFSSAITLYWVVSNAFQVVQTLLLQNPFKIRREREEKQRVEKARKRKIEKAKRRAYQSRRK